MKTRFFLKLSLAAIATLSSIVAISFVNTSCSKKANPPTGEYTIDANVAGSEAKDWATYNENSTTNYEIPNSINLKDLSQKNNDVDVFVIEGTITHTIFIPSDFSCWLIGANGSKIVVDDDNAITGLDNVTGIFIGNDKENKKNMNVGKNIKIADSFISTSSTSYDSTGIYSNASIFGTLDVYNNTISSSSSSSSRNIIISGVDVSTGTINILNNIISSSSSNRAYNIHFLASLPADITVSNNTMSVLSSTASVYNIYFSSSISKNISIIGNMFSSFSPASSADISNIYFRNNLFSTAIIIITKNVFSSHCSSSAYPYSIYFYENVNSTISITNNITSSFCSSYSSGIYFHKAVSGIITITGNTISSSGSSGSYGLYFDASVGGTLTINDNTISSSTSSVAYGIYFAAATSAPTGSNNILYWNGSSVIGVNNNYGGGSTFFSTTKKADSSKFGISTWTDLQNIEFTFKLYYVIGTTNSIPDQKQALIDKIADYNYTNTQNTAIVNGFVWNQTL